MLSILKILKNRDPAENWRSLFEDIEDFELRGEIRKSRRPGDATPGRSMLLFDRASLPIVTTVTPGAGEGAELPSNPQGNENLPRTLSSFEHGVPECSPG